MASLSIPSPATTRLWPAITSGIAWAFLDGSRATDKTRPHTQPQRFDQTAIDREAEPRIRTEDDLLRIARAQELWREGIEPRGTVAEQYLQARALDLPDDLAGNVLRFHPRCPWRNENTDQTERIPVLLAVFRSIIDDDEITAVHRIRVDQPTRWPRADRKMLGIVHRAAVKLDRDASDTLVIGEGVETGMAAQQLGHRPVWALGSVGAISFFPVLEHVKTFSSFLVRQARRALTQFNSAESGGRRRGDAFVLLDQPSARI